MTAKKSDETTKKIIIKDYEITGSIGKGGMGQVFTAKHPTLNREIILKQLKLRDKESKERFLREAELMMNFRHENIVQVYDHFVEGTSTYIAMEYVKGQPLNTVIQKHEMVPVDIALFILYQAAMGLHHAHVKKVIHRDIKPHNIMITENGDVKIIDFGIAKSKDSEKEALTAKGTVIGTPAYMAPEQFTGSAEVSYQTDIYALGVVFYEMITGVRPFKNEFSGEVLDAIARGRFIKASKYVKKMPNIAKKILTHTFTPDRKKRYKTFQPLVKILKHHFKKYNYYELQNSLKRLVGGDKNYSDYPLYKRKQEIEKNSFKLFVVTASIFTLSVLTFFFIYTDRYYEWIAANRYGKVILQFSRKNLDENTIFVGIDNKYEKAKFKKGPIPSKIEVVRFEKHILPQLNNENQTLLKQIYAKVTLNENEIYIKRKKLTKEEKVKVREIFNYTIYDRYYKEFYLEKGEHKFSVVSGSYKNTRREIIMPISMQKKNDFTENGKVVNIPLVDLWKQEVDAYFRFWNSLQNDELLFYFQNYDDPRSKSLDNEEVELKILVGKRYIALKDYIKSVKRYNDKNAVFLSDTTYKLKVENYKSGNREFIDKEFSVDFELDDRTVVVHMPLIPTPSSITLDLPDKKADIFFNAKEYGYVYNQTDYEFIKYKSVKPEETEDKRYIYSLQIPPGTYYFRIGKNGESKKIILKSNDSYSIKVEEKDGEYVY